MKKFLNILIPAAAAMILALACEKQQESPVQPEKAERITIKASIPESTKIAFEANDETHNLHIKWSEMDCIRVISGSQSELFDIEDGYTDHEAEFSGNAVSGSSFTILYPGDRFSSVAEAWDYDYFTQVQEGNGNTDHLCYIACLNNVDSYEDFTFSEDWATAHGGSFFVPGIAKIVATLPDGVTTLKSVSVSCSLGAFALGLKDVDVSASSQVLTAYAMIPWGGGYLPGNEPIRLSIIDGNDKEYGLVFTLDNTTELQQGHVSVFKFTKGVKRILFASGSGTETDPYVIETAQELQNMHEALVEGETVYFVLGADIDLDGQAWAPLNNAGTFTKGFYLDGGNHVISNLSVYSGAYPSFAGVLNGTVKNLTFYNANINAGAQTSGVLAGYVGSSSSSVTGNFSGISVLNSSVTEGTKNRVGGIAGYVNVVSEPIEDCHVFNTTVSSSAERIGGMFGQVDAGIKISQSTAENVTVSGNVNVGGLVGVCYGDLERCSSSGSISSPNATSNKDIGLGGLVGYFEKGTISKCSSSVDAVQTTNGRDIGGLIGLMRMSHVEESYCTGSAKGIQRNVGGFVGLISHTVEGSTATITNCYCTGDVEGNAYTGGFCGYYEKGACEISNCYACGDVNGFAFAIGGFIGVTAAAGLDMSYCAAWSNSVTAASIGVGNWSSASVVGVTYPTCTLTDNYRNPDMQLTAYWVPDADYNHANVSPMHPLVNQNGEETNAVNISSGQPDYPQYPYFGKVEAGKTLSQLASSKLGWSSSIWNFSGDLPIFN